MSDSLEKALDASSLPEEVKGMVRKMRDDIVATAADRMDALTSENARLREIAHMVLAAEQSPRATGKTGYTRPTDKQWTEIVDAARAVLPRKADDE